MHDWWHLFDVFIALTIGALAGYNQGIKHAARLREEELRLLKRLVKMQDSMEEVRKFLERYK